MPIQIEPEALISLECARRLIPGRGRDTVSVNTLKRWSRIGVCGVRLQTVYAGQTICTTREAIADFVSGVTQARHARLVGGRAP